MIILHRSQPAINVRTVFLIIILGCVSSTVHSQPPLIDPNQIDIAFQENVSTNQLTCNGSTPVAWFFPRNKTLYFGPENVQQNITLDTTGVDLQRFVGFYYCYYVSAIEPNLISEVNLESLMKKNKASRIYVYVNNSKQQVVTIKNTTLTGTYDSEINIPCLPTSDNGITNLQDFDGNQLDNGTYVRYIGFHWKISRKAETIRCMYNDIQEFIFNINVTGSHIGHPTITTDNYGYGEEGGNMSLVCWAAAKTAKKIEWILPLKEDSTINITTQNSNDNQSKLFITDLNRTRHQGKYTCKSSNGDKNKSSDIDVLVLARNGCEIKIWEHANLTELSVETNITKIWNLSYKGYPNNISVEWFRPNGERINNSTDFTIIHIPPRESHRTTQLHLHHPMLRPAGLYRLDGYNGICNTSTQFRLIKMMPPTVTFEDQTVKSDSELKIDFGMTGYPKPAVKCSYRDCPFIQNTTWPITKNCSEPKPLSTHLSQEKMDGYIKLSPNSPGILTCQVNNSQNKSQHSANIYIWDSDTNLKNEIPSLEVVYGEKIQINCIVSRYHFTSSISIEGSEGRKIDSIPKSHITTEKYAYNMTMTFNNFLKGDEGNYTCSAKKSDATKETQSAILAVLYPIEPNFNGLKSKNTIHAVNQSQPLILHCEPMGIPKPSVDWFKDSQIKIQSNNHTKVNDTHLYIDRPTQADNGEYECRATGRKNATASMYFEVKIGSSIGWVLWILAISLVALSMLCLILIIFYRRERIKRIQLTYAGISYFVEGNENNLNPEKTIMEQADLLRYDTQFDFAMKNLKLGKILGSGAFGEVLMGEAIGLMPGEAVTTVAVKRVKAPPKDEEIKALITELKIMIYIGKHVNVVNILGVVRDNIKERQLLVLTEFCEFGNLYEYLAKNRKNFVNQIDNSGIIDPTITTNLEKKNQSKLKYTTISFPNPSNVSPLFSNQQIHECPIDLVVSTPNGENTLIFSNGNETELQDRASPLLSNGTRYVNQSTGTGSYIEPNLQLITTTDLVSWSFQVTQGMQYLSTRGVLHGDLAARNVLLCRNGIVKICDFGLSRAMRNNEDYQKESAVPLPIKWLALESITQKIFNTSTDVWSFGVFMWELFSLSSVPYPGIPTRDLLMRLKNGYRMAQPKYANQDIYEIILSCWKLSPSSRPTFTKLSFLLSQHMPEKLKQEVIEQNNGYLVARPDYNFASVFVSADGDEGLDNIALESVPMLASATNEDISIPLEQAPSAPPISPPKSTIPLQRNYENIPTNIAPDKDIAISNPGYIAVYKK